MLGSGHFAGLGPNIKAAEAGWEASVAESSILWLESEECFHILASRMPSKVV